MHANTSPEKKKKTAHGNHHIITTHMWLPCILWGSPMGRWKKRQLGFLLRHIQTWAWSRGRLWHCINTASAWGWWRDMVRTSSNHLCWKNTSTRARITGSKTSTEAGSHSNLVNIAGVTKINCATSNWPVPTHSFLLLLIDMASIFIMDPEQLRTETRL